MKILITGDPGTGKTTLIKKLMDSLDWPKAGFYTEEIRESGARKGFKFETLKGEKGILAHVDFSGPMRVGKYGIRLELFENLAVSSIEEGIQRQCLIVIDEIGKMELFSRRFQAVLIKAFDSDSPVLATIGKFFHPLLKEIKNQSDVVLFELTCANRSALEQEIRTLLLKGAVN